MKMKNLKRLLLLLIFVSVPFIAYADDDPCENAPNCTGNENGICTCQNGEYCSIAPTESAPNLCTSCNPAASFIDSEYGQGPNGEGVYTKKICYKNCIDSENMTQQPVEHGTWVAQAERVYYNEDHPDEQSDCTYTLNCNAGYYKNENTCKPCASGTYSATAGATACTSCDPGKYSDPGASQCENCPRGWYCPRSENNGPTTKIPCPPGKTSNESSTKVNDCHFMAGPTGTKFCDKYGCFTLPANAVILGP